LENSETEREQEATALRTWFSSQNRFGSWAAMERALKLTKDYLHSIKSGERRAVDPELRSKLFETTRLEAFRPIVRGVKSRKPQRKMQRKISQQSPRDRDGIEQLRDDPSERATRIKILLIKLADELEFFKQKPEPVRRIFRKEIPGEDIGYVTTLLRALYDEDQFQRWLLFSDYKLKSKEENKNVPAGKA
jgi:hypothetical protein